MPPWPASGGPEAVSDVPGSTLVEFCLVEKLGKADGAVRKAFSDAAMLGGQPEIGGAAFATGLGTVVCKAMARHWRANPARAHVVLKQL